MIFRKLKTGIDTVNNTLYIDRANKLRLFSSLAGGVGEFYSGKKIPIGKKFREAICMPKNVGTLFEHSNFVANKFRFWNGF